MALAGLDITLARLGSPYPSHISKFNVEFKDSIHFLLNGVQELIES